MYLGAKRRNINTLPFLSTKSHNYLPGNRKGIWDVKSPYNISKSFLLGQLQIRRLVDKNSMRMHNAPQLSSVSITAIQAVFLSAVLARILYASPAWWGFAGVQEDRQKVGFLAS